MFADKLTNLKKELKNRPPEEVFDIAMRLAKNKVENKELLTYLLSFDEDPDRYATDYKEEFENTFAALSENVWASLKSLRKLERSLAKFKRFTKSDEHLIDLKFHLVRLIMSHFGSHLRSAPIIRMVARQLKQSERIIQKLHEDLQYDYANEYNELITEVAKYFVYWDPYEFPLDDILL